MRFIVCGDSLFSSRNLVKRLDKKLVNWFREADGAFTNAEFCTPEPETPPACRTRLYDLCSAGHIG